MKKLIKIIFEAAALIFALSIWLYSFYKIAVYVKLDKIFAVRASCSFPNPPCPPGCCVPTPTPTPTIEPIATPTLPVPTLTSAPSPSPTITPSPTATPILGEPTPTPTVASEPTPTPTTKVIEESGGIGGLGGPGEAPHCGLQTPPTPYLRKASVIKSGSVELIWDPVTPVTHYNISYGFFPGIYLYGVVNTGNVSSFTIGGLEKGIDYCFALRAVNDCAPGGLSNEICTGGAVTEVSPGEILGASVLGATGNFEEDIFLSLFIIGCICVSIGLKFFVPCQKPV